MSSLGCQDTHFLLPFIEAFLPAFMCGSFSGDLECTSNSFTGFDTNCLKVCLLVHFYTFLVIQNPLFDIYQGFQTIYDMFYHFLLFPKVKPAPPTAAGERPEAVIWWGEVV